MIDKKTTLYDLHVQSGAKMIPFAGFLMPVRYTSDKDEHLRVRQKVGIFDVSHMGEFFISGKGALELIQYVTSNDASKLEDGKAQYSYLPNREGGIIDDLLVYRIKEDHYMLVVNAGNIEKDWKWIVSHNTFGAVMENASDDYSLFAVQGPSSTAILQKLTNIDLSAIAFYTFTTGTLGGIDDVIISATGYTGAGGFELYVKNKEAVGLWKAILEAGEDQGIQPIGLGARDTLRMEMGYCLYGNDIDDTTSPIEAGLGWVTKFNKQFINADTLKQQKEKGVSRKLVGFKIVDKGIPRQGYEIENTDGQTIGHVTSGTMSPSLGVGIGLGYIKKENSAPDSKIFIKIRDKRVEATVCKLPFIQ